MGVPNLYRWLSCVRRRAPPRASPPVPTHYPPLASLSERYPLINRPVNDSLPMPEIDNLYLDANGILHNATHGDAGARRPRGGPAGCEDQRMLSLLRLHPAQRGLYTEKQTSNYYLPSPLTL